MKDTTILRISQASGAAATLVILFAIIYLFRVGFKSAQHTYWKVMDLALLLLVLSALFAVRHTAIVWKDRPDKQRRLQIAKLLVLILIVLAIPMAVVNWRR